MQGSNSYHDKRAPLAYLESFESRIEESNEMKEYWSNDNQVRDNENFHQSWNGNDFADMTRKQQNCKMYKVLKIQQMGFHNFADNIEWYYR